MSDVVKGSPAAENLERGAQAFALSLSQTVRSAFGPSVPAFLARISPGARRCEIHQDPLDGLALTIGGVPRLLMKVQLSCTLDRSEEYVAVDMSAVSVLSAAHRNKEPLFRYEYLREPRGGQASAHLQVHAHRDVTTFLMSVCGDSSVRARRRKQSALGEGRVPQLSDIHFPVGGPRFRPCIEDVLEMIMDEFGVDHQEGAREALARGRHDWRLQQLAAAVRDSPATAARVLRDLGYIVQEKGDEAVPDRTDKLRML